MKLHVQCYSGTKADERPVRFRLDDREYLVEEILDQWYGPEHPFFKLRADSASLPEGARLRRVRVIRDYAMYDRREAPQLLS